MANLIKINDKYSIQSVSKIDNDNLHYNLKVTLNKDQSVQQDLNFYIKVNEFPKLTEELQDFLMKFYSLNPNEIKLDATITKEPYIKKDIEINSKQTLAVRTTEHNNGDIEYKLKVYLTENPEWVTERIDFRVANLAFPKFANELAQVMKTADSYQVLQFTEQSKNIKCPTSPVVMTAEEMRFLYQMVLSELVEGAQTVCDDTDAALEFVRKCIGTDTNRAYKKPTDNLEIIAQQADALVDAWYYMLNAACKKGWNLSPVFGEVHLANMNKRWSDGKFHIREDGKIEKPPNHQPADVVAVIKKQFIF